MRISQEEQAAIASVVNAGRQFGYGNMISHLQTVWAAELVRKYGMSEDSARRSTVMAEGGYAFQMHEDLLTKGWWDETGERYAKRDADGDQVAASSAPCNQSVAEMIRTRMTDRDTLTIVRDPQTKAVFMRLDVRFRMGEPGYGEPVIWTGGRIVSYDFIELYEGDPLAVELTELLDQRDHALKEAGHD